MKRNYFIRYAEEVMSVFNITKDELFAKNKKRNISEARQLLYYLCYNRPMRITDIKYHLSEFGYVTEHPSIIYGIKMISYRADGDNDYFKLIKKIQECVV
jgi:chromosomal replication initiation ATPase DnaA